MELFTQLKAAADATRRKLGPLRPENLETKVVTAVVEFPAQDHLSTSKARTLGLVALVMSACLIVFAAATALGFVPLFSSEVLRWGVAAGAIFFAVACPMLAAFQGEMKVISAVENRPSAPRSLSVGEKVGIEPGATYKNFKIIADDMGVMYHDEDNRRILVDGTRYRLSICSQDVRSTALGSVKIGAGVQLQIDIHGAPIDIVISARNAKTVNPDDRWMLGSNWRIAFGRRWGWWVRIDSPGCGRRGDAGAVRMDDVLAWMLLRFGIESV